MHSPAARRTAQPKKVQEASLRSIQSVFKNPRGLPPGHGVIYLGHIPHGFFEKEIFGYFQQFGKIVQVKVARSAKTGQSRGYSFIEFQDENVAQIAANTMNNYLLFERLLKCHTVSFESNPEKYAQTFTNSYRGGNLRELNILARYSRSKVKHVRAHNKSKTVQQAASSAKRAKKSVKRLAETLREHGISFDYDALHIGSKKTTESSSSQPTPVAGGSSDVKEKITPSAMEVAVANPPEVRNLRSALRKREVKVVEPSVAKKRKLPA